MTPREIVGSLFFARRRLKRQAAEAMALHATAARGKPQDIKKRIKQLSED